MGSSNKMCCLSTRPSWATKPEIQNSWAEQIARTESRVDLELCLLGKVDVEAVALAGHSYGGATVTALCSQEPAFKCTVALDPWWLVSISLLPIFCISLLRST